ncbi:MAG: carbon-phosphorus lyase complex subunit PhnI, partial [Thermodesulfobacteriota bacterium]
MGYVAVKGGSEAIGNACRLFARERSKGGSSPLKIDQVREQLYLAVDRVMGEGSLYAPDLAALAIKQSAGDTFEASFLLRAHRATQPRLARTLPVDPGKMRAIRRISSAFKDIPGGQLLGPTSDYTLRLLDFSLLEDDDARRDAFRERVFDAALPGIEVPETFPKVIDILRREGLLEPIEDAGEACLPVGKPQPFDVTRQSLTFPAPRSAVLQSLARGETGGMLLLAYSSMRGYGNIHPTLGELRVGYLPVEIAHPVTGEPFEVGEVKVT